MKQDHYKRDIGRIPRKESVSLESIGVMSTAITELNRGLNWVFYEGVAKLDKRIEALLDFSYAVMGWIGAAGEKIDWDNPEKFFEQVQETEHKLNAALEEKRTLEKKFEDDHQAWLEDLASKDTIIRDKDGEMAARDGKWSARFSWWFRILVWLFIGLAIVAFVMYGWNVALRMIAGLPFKAALFSGKLLKKVAHSSIDGVQRYREILKRDAEQGDEKAEANLNVLKHCFDQSQDNDVRTVIERVKKMNGKH